MNQRSTVVGMLVLALLVAGMYVARSRQTAAVPLASGQRAETRTTAPSTTGADDSLPDATLVEVTLFDGDVAFRTALSPTPPVAFRTVRVRIRPERDGAPLALGGGSVAFEMVMPMGDHIYTLSTAPDGWYEADVTLPLCKSGKRRWYGTITGRVGGQDRRARFLLDLANPA